MSTPASNPSWSPDAKRIAAVVGLIAIVGLVVLSRPVLSLLIWAALLAYIFQPLVGLLERLRVPRSIGTLLSMLLLLVVLGLAPILLIPAIADQIALIEVDIPLISQRLLGWWEVIQARYPSIELFGYQIDLALAVEQASQYLVAGAADLQVPTISEFVDYLLTGVRTASGLLGTATGLATGVVSAVVATSVAAIFLFMYTFYLTKDGNRLRTWMTNLVPAGHRPQVEQLLARIARTWAAFFRGQILLSLTIAIVTTISLAVIGMPGSLVLGLIAGLLEVVPTLGPLLAMIPALILALIQGSLTLGVANWAFALITLGVYLVIQQLENALIVPRIMGQSLNLHPLVVLVGIVVGASTAGLLGAFLAAPVLATLRLIALYVHAKLLDLEPFPAQPAQRPSIARAAEPKASEDGAGIEAGAETRTQSEPQSQTHPESEIS